MPKIDGNAQSGGPQGGQGIKAPRKPFTYSTEPRDIVSRLEAAHGRVSPVGEVDLSVEASKVRPARGRQPVRFDRVEIAALYRRGNTAPKIAELLGCTAATVYTALREQGVTRGDRGRLR